MIHTGITQGPWGDTDRDAAGCSDVIPYMGGEDSKSEAKWARPARADFHDFSKNQIHKNVAIIAGHAVADRLLHLLLFTQQILK